MTYEEPKPYIISIHSPRAGRDGAEEYGHFSITISIHSPRAGRDPFRDWALANGYAISIHSPRAGRDGRAAEDSAIW